MSSYKCRCNKCGKRRTLANHPDHYTNHLYCPECKAKDSFRVDEYRQSKRESKRYTCHCGGVPYPHRKGSIVFCVHSDDEPTVDDMMKLTDSVRKH